MKVKFVAALLILMAIGISNADAQVKAREKNQRARIKQGIKSGELTKAETANLAHKEKDIRKEKRAAKADGVVTPAERKDIRKDQNQASRAIYRKKHNGRERN
jgi:hypothetical protein